MAIFKKGDFVIVKNFENPMEIVLVKENSIKIKPIDSSGYAEVPKNWIIQKTMVVGRYGKK